MIFYLGDIHGNFNLINQYIKMYGIKDAHIIQVGDFGVGFNTFEKEKRLLQMTHDVLVKNNIMVCAIRGNHDYKPYFDNDPFQFTNIKLVKDYTVLNLEGKNILCIGGAVSVDREWRYTKAQKLGTYTTPTMGHESWWPDEIIELDIDKLKDLGVQRHQMIVADSAEPKSIEDLRRAGYRIEGAKKGPDSIRNSIDTLQQYEMFITKDSLNAIKELRNYKF